MLCSVLIASLIFEDLRTDSSVYYPWKAYHFFGFITYMMVQELIKHSRWLIIGGAAVVFSYYYNMVVNEAFSVISSWRLIEFYLIRINFEHQRDHINRVEKAVDLVSW